MDQAPKKLSLYLYQKDSTGSVKVHNVSANVGSVPPIDDVDARLAVRSLGDRMAYDYLQIPRANRIRFAATPLSVPVKLLGRLNRSSDRFADQISPSKLVVVSGGSSEVLNIERLSPSSARLFSEAPPVYRPLSSAPSRFELHTLAVDVPVRISVSYTGVPGRPGVPYSSLELVSEVLRRLLLVKSFASFIGFVSLADRPRTGV